MTVRVLGMLAVVSFVMLACDSEPKAGELVVSYSTPEPDDRAIMFRITADESYTVNGVNAACSDCQVFSHSVSDAKLGGIVTGTLRYPVLLRIAVSNAQALDAYTVRLLQVAGPDFELRPTVGRLLEICGWRLGVNVCTAAPGP